MSRPVCPSVVDAGHIMMSCMIGQRIPWALHLEITCGQCCILEFAWQYLSQPMAATVNTSASFLHAPMRMRLSAPAPGGSFRSSSWVSCVYGLQWNIFQPVKSLIFTFSFNPLQIHASFPLTTKHRQRCNVHRQFVFRISRI